MGKNQKSKPSKKPVAELDPSKLNNQINSNIGEINKNKDSINVFNYRDVLSKKQLKKLRKKRASFFYKAASSFSIFIYSILLTVSIVLIVAIFEGPSIAVKVVEKYNGTEITKPDDATELESILYGTIEECEEATIGGCIDIIEQTIVDDIFWPTVDTVFEGGDFIIGETPVEPWEGINPMIHELINETNFQIIDGNPEIIGIEALIDSINEAFIEMNTELNNFLETTSGVTINSDLLIPSRVDTDPNPDIDNSLDGGIILKGSYSILGSVNELKEVQKNDTLDLTAEDIPNFPEIAEELYSPLLILANEGINIDKENIVLISDKDFSWLRFIDELIDEAIRVVEEDIITLILEQINGIVIQIEKTNDEIQKIEEFNIGFTLDENSSYPIIETINNIIIETEITITKILNKSKEAVDNVESLAAKAENALTLVDDTNDEIESVQEMINELEVMKDEYKTNPDVMKASDIYTLTTNLLLAAEIGSWLLLIFSLMGIIVLRQNKKGKLGNRWVALPFTIVFVIPALATIFGRMEDLDEIFEVELANINNTKN